jgi:uncharacterized protein YbjT (DUF2867 family)
MKILVTGTTGNIGAKLVPRLLAKGHQVTCIVRNPQKLDRFHWPQVSILQADVLDIDHVRRAMPGIEVAYYLIHSMSGGKHHFIEHDTKAAHNFGTAAREAGVQRIIYLGGLGQCEKSLSAHLDSRQKVGDILRLSGVPVTEFRAPIVIGSGSMSFEMIRYLTERLPILFTPSWIDTLCQPIAIENILEYLVDSLSEPLSIGNIFEIGGPDVMTYREIMLGFAAARKLKRPLMTLPFLTSWLLAFGADVITPLPTPYLQILIDGLRSEVMVNDPSAREVFKNKLIPYADAVAHALIRDGSGEVESLWAGARVELEPGVTHKDTEGMFIEQRRTASTASTELVYAVIEKIGGKQGWYFANWLWQLRGWLDELAGGVGMRRGRSNPDEFTTGDIVDGWKVEEVQPGRLVRLWFELKAPGPAWLQFEVQSRAGGGSLLILSAFFEPHGVAGLLYWYSLYPFHLLIFKYMSRAILKRAESMSQA